MSERAVIDAHVHLFEKEDLYKLAWALPGSSLWSEHNFVQYPTSNDVIYVEVDRKHDINLKQWQFCLEEMQYASSMDRVKAVTAWAPLPAGSDTVRSYLRDLPPKVRAFRYLLQDKPQGTLLQFDFLSSLEVLAEGGYVFEFGIDANGGGTWQLRETLATLELLKGLGGIYVIDHMGKPPFRNMDRFSAWASLMKKIAAHQNVYCKLSGLLTELPADILADEDAIVKMVKEAVSLVLESFQGRVLFGSDWPVCTLAGSYELWQRVVVTLLNELRIDDQTQAGIWCGNARKVYSI